jgi:hypothetical protein
MNLVFNEISFLPHLDNESILTQNFLELIKTFEKAKEDYGFNHLVFPSNIRDINVTSTKTFYDWVYAIGHQGDKNKILSVVKKPYTNEVLEQQVVELCKYYYVNLVAGIPETYCSGLATAHLKVSLCTSLSTIPFKDKTKIDFHEIINDKLETKEVFANNISNKDHLEVEKIKKFIEYLGDVQLDESKIDPKTKPIALRDDHGKDKLLSFSKRLVNSKYVLSVINSLPFNPKATNLIRAIYPDGKIELVLYWEDRGIGLVIQTTGRNYRETQEIAKIIKKEFDK